MKFNVLLVFLLLSPGFAFAADDTFSCFTQFTGPIVKTFSGDQGYINFSLGNWTTNSRIDARGAIFRQEHFLSGGTKPDRPWIITLGGNNDAEPKAALCFVGGRFIGSTPTGATYRNVKNNAGAALEMNSDGAVIDGVRSHNMHEDTLQLIAGNLAARRPHKMRYVKNTWISYNKGNAIENDHVANLTIDDTLIDGSFTPISVDPSAVWEGDPTAQNNNQLIVSNSLVRMLYLPNSIVGSGEPVDYGMGWIKIRLPEPVPIIRVHNSVFATDGWSADEGETRRTEKVWEHIRTRGSCSNNVIAWLSDKPLPSNFSTPPSCFRIVKGQEARDLWNAAKQNWINCHPKVEHIPGDPAANPSACNPNAYGGGEGGSTIPTTTGGGSTTGSTAIPGDCETFASGAGPSAGYGAAWNPLTSARELLLTAYCHEGASTDLYVGKTGAYTYKMGYYYTSLWQPFTMTGTFAEGSVDWLTGKGKAMLRPGPSGNFFWVGYVCQWTGTIWKCGCRDAACTTPYWQLQGVKR